MPWTPEQAKKKYKKLTKHQASLWSKVANAALESGDDEATAIKKANGAVNRVRKQESLSEVAINISEVGKSISAANGKQIKAALKAMKDAMEVIAPLIADDADEEVEESTTENPLNPKRPPLWESVKLEEVGKILAQSDSYDSIRYAVSHALRKRAIADNLATKLSDGSLEAGYDEYYYSCQPYIRDLYDDYVVYSLDGQLYQCTYEVTDDSVTLGDEVEVQVSYVPVSDNTTTYESVEYIKGDLIQLTEKAVKDDGSARIKLISPGWGSSGYYSASMLERDGPKAFPKGTHTYVNHPTEEEDRNRPERDLKDLAGVITSDVVWEKASSNNTGDGLYADVKVFPTYRQFIDEAASHIGVSIRAGGTAIEGEAEGRHGLLVDSLKEGYSVDYVTYPGRGGQVLPLYESAKSRISNVKIDEVTHAAIIQLKETDSSVGVTSANTEVKDLIVVDISAEELAALKEGAAKASTLETQISALESSNKKITNALIMSEARLLVNDTLSGIEMLPAVRAKVLAECVRSIPLKEGALDTDVLIERVKETAAAELKYIEAVTGTVTAGKVQGVGASEATELKAEDVDAGLKEAFKSYFDNGYSDDVATKTADVAFAGRN